MAQIFPNVVEIDGKKYKFELPIDAHRRVKERAQVSLPDCIANLRGKRTEEEQRKAMEGYHALMSDFDRLPIVMYAMLEPQLKEHGITSPEQFEQKLTGSIVLKAADAITQALIDFFPEADARRKLLVSAIETSEKMEAIGQKFQDKATAQLDQQLAEMDQKIDQEGDNAAKLMLHETLTNSLKTLPASLAAILAPSRSGN